MINYSVYMMGNPIKPEMPEKAYAKAQVNEVMSFSQFVQHIANHNGVFSRGTVKGVVSDTCECLVEQLLNGNKVRLENWGPLLSRWVVRGGKHQEVHLGQHHRCKHPLHAGRGFRESAFPSYVQPREQPCRATSHLQGGTCGRDHGRSEGGKEETILGWRLRLRESR